MICICDYLGLSESSASHRLNDVQDVQDMARIQQESKYLSTHPSLIKKKFINKYHQNGQWGMIKGSGES